MVDQPSTPLRVTLTIAGTGGLFLVIWDLALRIRAREDAVLARHSS
ncbi:hypothetical protein BH11MYX3_BH11MYX3_10660 [soil metagenome]